MKAPSPLLGFNNNVRHKGRVFHIQTEDSGIRHPHVITHLFADGGRILKTTKTSYAEHLGQTAMAEMVRGMMQEQHKAMFIALRDGQFDHMFEDPSGPSSTRAPRPAPAPPPPKPAPLPPEPPPQAAPVSQRAPLSQRPAPLSQRPAPLSQRPAPLSQRPAAMAPAASAESPNGPPSRRVSSRPKLEMDPGALHRRDAPTATAVAVVAPSSAETTIDLDLDALERAAAEAQTPFFQQIHDLPPPPAAVLGKKSAGAGPVGSYSVTPVHEPPPRQSPPPQPMRQPPPASVPPATPITARYAPSRPAAIFATARPPEGASIFGEELISEKSLDEVILSYLAEDLEGPSDKK